MKSPIQVLPIVKMLQSLALTETEKEQLFITFNNSLRLIYGDDRSFSYSMQYESPTKEILDLLKKFPSNSLIPDSVKYDYREYIVRNLSGIRCQDSFNFEKMVIRIAEKAEKKEPLNEIENLYKSFYVSEANNLIFKDNPIKYKELAPSKVIEYTLPVAYLTQTRWADLSNKIEDLRFWENNNETKSEVKKQEEWVEKFDEVLESIRNTEKHDNENSIDEFHQKCLLYNDIFSLSPPKNLKEKVIKSYLNLLEKNDIKKEFPAEWLWQFQQFISLIDEIKTSEKEKLLGIVENSKDQVILSYIEINKQIASEKNKLKVK
jgi:hypothetical protein